MAFKKVLGDMLPVATATEPGVQKLISPATSASDLSNGNAGTVSLASDSVDIKNRTLAVTPAAVQSIIARGHYGTCSSDSVTVNKVATLPNFILNNGARVAIKFTNANTANAPTLNINDTGDKNIYHNNQPLTGNNTKLVAGMVAILQYDGINWNLLNANADVSAATAATPTTNGNIGIAIYAADNDKTSRDKAATPAGVAAQISGINLPGSYTSKLFTSSGSMTLPKAGPVFCILVGGGGGGGGAPTGGNSDTQIGGSGGSGACMNYVLWSSANASLTVTIGGGGSAGTATSTGGGGGGGGGQTSVSVNGAGTVYAGGGGGGGGAGMSSVTPAMHGGGGGSGGGTRGNGTAGAASSGTTGGNGGNGGDDFQGLWSKDGATLGTAYTSPVSWLGNTNYGRGGYGRLRATGIAGTSGAALIIYPV